MLRTIRTLCLVVFVLLGAAGPAWAEPRKPNIVFILADDLGGADLGCYGADLHETPELDRFATQGVRFTHAYAMSVCSPTRSAIMTGKHAARLHITIWREGSFDGPGRNQKLQQPDSAHDLPLDETTSAEMLRSAGYLTFHVGKWHLGDGDHYPEAQGFDINIGGTHWGAPATFFHPYLGKTGSGELRYVPGLGLGKKGDHLADRFAEEAIKLIDQAGERPFFLNLCFHDPHTPIEAKPELVEHFKKKLSPSMRHQNPTYAAMVKTLDTNVGRVLRHLDERGLAKDTIVVFTSDNGGFLGKSGGQGVTNNAPLRSGKGSLYEGGVRVPMIVRWPGVTPAGATCAAPVLCTDYFRTWSEVAGKPVDDPALLEDGRSLVPLFRDPAAARLDREALFFHYPHYYATTTPASAVHEGDWKLLEYFEDGRLELYNLKEDPTEAKNLAAQEPERAKRLHEQLAAWRTKVGAQLPSPNSDRQPASAPAKRAPKKK